MNKHKNPVLSDCMSSNTVSTTVELSCVQRVNQWAVIASTCLLKSKRVCHGGRRWAGCRWGRSKVTDVHVVKRWRLWPEDDASVFLSGKIDSKSIKINMSTWPLTLCLTDVDLANAVFVVVIYVFGAVDKTSSSFSAHGKIGNFIISSSSCTTGKVIFLRQGVSCRYVTRGKCTQGLYRYTVSGSLWHATLDSLI